MNRPKRGARSTPCGSRRGTAKGNGNRCVSLEFRLAAQRSRQIAWRRSSGEIRSQGFNTDADGIARSLREDLNLELTGAKVLLLGTGGAGQVAALRLAVEKVSELFLVDFVSAKAEAVAQEIRKRHPQVKVATGFPQGPVDLLLNATPLGLKPGDASPLEESGLRCSGRARFTT